MRLFRPILLAALALPLAGPAAFADDAQDKAVVTGVMTRFLAPKYAALAAAAADNAKAWSAYCARRTAGGLKAAQAGFRTVSLAYGEVQAFRFGPAGDGATSERLYFWPERKNATAKGLAGLLAGSGPITPEKVKQASAAAQGIPALERLAYGEDGRTPAVSAHGAEGARACEAAVAIAGSVAGLSRSVSDAWNAPETGLAARITRGDLDPALAPNMQQAASELVTGFMTGLAVIQDQKLEPVLGSGGGEPKPSLAEAWRSGLTVPMILANVDGLKAFVDALGDAVPAIQRKSWEALVARIATEAKAMQDYPQGVTDDAKRATAFNMLGRLASIRAILKDEVPVALGLKLGFNGLDGD